MNIQGIKSLATSDITLKELRVVLIFACQEAEFGTTCIHLQDLAQSLKTTPQDICATMRKLENNGIIQRLDGAKRGRGTNGYNIRIHYPSDNTDYIPAETNPATSADRRLEASEKARLQAEKNLEVQQQENTKMSHIISEMKQEINHMLIKQAEMEKMAAQIQLEITKEEESPGRLLKKLLKSIFRWA